MKAKCQFCHYEWTPRSACPVMCPRCHSTKWNGDEVPHFTIRKKLECTRCHYKWAPRDDSPPKVCPQCKTTLWNTPRKLKIKESRMAKPKTAKRESSYPYRKAKAAPRKGSSKKSL